MRRVPQRLNSVRGEYGLAVVDQLVYTAGNVVLTFAWAAAYGPDQFGLLALVTTIGLVVGVSARAYWCDPLAVCGADQRTNLIGILVASTRATACAGAIVTASLWLLVAPGIEPLDIVLATAAVITLAMVELLRGAAVALRRYPDAVAIDTAWLALAGVAAGTVCVLGVGYRWALGATAFPSVCVLAVWARRESRRPDAVAPSWRPGWKRQGIHYAVDFWLLNGVLQSSVVVVGLSTGPAELGSFRLALTVLGPIGIGVRIAQVSLLPIASASVRGSRRTVWQLGSIASIGLGVISVAYLGGVLLIASVRGGILGASTRVLLVLGIAKSLESMAAGIMLALKAASVLVRVTVINAVTALTTGVLLFAFRHRLSALNASKISAAVSGISLLLWVLALVMMRNQRPGDQAGRGPGRLASGLGSELKLRTDGSGQ